MQCLDVFAKKKKPIQIYTIKGVKNVTSLKW